MSLVRGDQEGLTVLELVLVLFIGGLMLAVIGRSLVLGLRQSQSSVDQLTVSHDLRTAAAWLIPDVNSASHAHIVSSTQLVLTVPQPTSAITVRYYLTPTEQAGQYYLIREVNGGGGMPVARFADEEVDFGPPGTPIPAPTVLRVTLSSAEGGVRASNTLYLSMRLAQTPVPTPTPTVTPTATVTPTPTQTPTNTPTPTPA